MGLQSWIYDRLPTSVQQWLDDREFSRMADEQYDLAHPDPVTKDTADADLERLEHEQSPVASKWSGDRGAELERLERSEQTHSERSLDEPPERGIEDDDEELER